MKKNMDMAAPARVQQPSVTPKRQLSYSSDLGRFGNPPVSPLAGMPTISRQESQNSTRSHFFKSSQPSAQHTSATSGANSTPMSPGERPSSAPTATSNGRSRSFDASSGSSSWLKSEGSSGPASPRGDEPTGGVASSGIQTKKARRVMAEENIKVVCRCRPLNEREKNDLNQNLENSVDADSSTNEVRVAIPHKGKNRTFRFDKVYGPDSTQEQVFETSVRPIIDEVLEGFNCTIFAYGQTGTGKTHTMEGENSFDGSGLGVIPRAVRLIFGHLESTKSDFTVKASYSELYNEDLCDLLGARDKPLRIMENREKQLEVKGLTDIIVTKASDITQLMHKAWQKRHTARTLLNDRSSRSHAIFTLTVRIRVAMSGGDDFIKTGKLNLVDLAGSENIARSGSIKQQAKEAGDINKSLLTLGRVISALTEGENFVPYRDSKLTRLLQESLGGKAQTCIIATISPTLAYIEETVNTLDYASRAKSIKNKPEKNITVNKNIQIAEYEEQIKSLKDQLENMSNSMGVVSLQEFKDLQEELNELKAKKQRPL